MPLLFVLFACSGGSSEDFASVFAAGGDVDDTYYCTETTYSRTEGRADQPVFNPAAGVLYPGNLLQGKGIVDGVLQPIPLDRGPGDIVIDLVNGSTTPGVSVDQMSFKSVAEAMNTIVTETPDDLPARTRYSMKQVRSAEELAVAIGVDFEIIGFALEGEFNYQESSEYNRFVVQLTQEYYTMVYDLPTTYDEVFAPEVTSDQLATYVQPGNPAAFVHSVTYGRMFYLLIQSTNTVQQISASIDASFSAAVASGSVSADASYISELSDLSIGGWAEGGDASLAGGALQGDVDALSAFIEDGGTITTGVPLSYVVRSVNRPDLILNVGRADEYTVEECVSMGQSIAGGVLHYDGDITETEHNSSIGVSSLLSWPDQVPENGDDYDGLPPNLAYSGWVAPDAGLWLERPQGHHHLYRRANPGAARGEDAQPRRQRLDGVDKVRDRRLDMLDVVQDEQRDALVVQDRPERLRGRMGGRNGERARWRRTHRSP
jgi:hypothetical protein